MGERQDIRYTGAVFFQQRFKVPFRMRLLHEPRTGSSYKEIWPLDERHEFAELLPSKNFGGAICPLFEIPVV